MANNFLTVLSTILVELCLLDRNIPAAANSHLYASVNSHAHHYPGDIWRCRIPDDNAPTHVTLSDAWASLPATTNSESRPADFAGAGKASTQIEAYHTSVFCLALKIFPPVAQWCLFFIFSSLVDPGVDFEIAGLFPKKTGATLDTRLCHSLTHRGPSLSCPAARKHNHGWMKADSYHACKDRSEAQNHGRNPPGDLLDNPWVNYS
ncbi:hypothetical protein T310_2874 [Rasamsonia emersonii CBS 393.64]|uniref:Uncharacterized protein n=1 Tax=Rasamsonia emersonii (strain ATCC 16479 / CBS 393.64 / IMI 116815) TaxID=1408163 RepID=A0A0F4YZV2_RASE3|nr:hypothetical protein T310_2874 [Rasamsonia emersonii CBS 393.64]KKA23148.1 hypothetical protein T310_2874 [Rasamsonia emersonii CBS 393.64]